MKVSNQNWWLDWYLYCPWRKSLGWWVLLILLVFFKYFAALVASVQVFISCCSYPLLFGPCCIPPPPSQHFSGRRKWSTVPRTSDASRARAPGWLRQGNPWWIHGESMSWHIVKWKGSPNSWMVYKGKCHSNEDEVPGVPLFYVFTCVQHVLQCRESYHLKSQSFCASKIGLIPSPPCWWHL